MKPERITAVLTGIIAAVALALVLKVTRTVVLPLTVAFLFSFIFAPVVKFCIKKGMPRLAAVAVVLAFLVGLFLLLGVFLVTSVQSFVHEYPVYLSKLREIAGDLSSRYFSALNITEANLAAINLSRVLKDSLVSGSRALFSLLGIVIVMGIILFFLFLETSGFSAKLAKAFPSRTSKRIRIMFERATRQISSYLSVKLMLSFATGVIVWLLLTVLGLDFPLVWGVLAFILNFIPNIGHVIVVVFVGLQSLVQTYPRFGLFALVIAVLTVSFAVLGSLLEPRLAGGRPSVSPVVMLASLLFWGWVWGVVGALISVPIAASFKIVCENVPALKPVGVLMGAGGLRRKRRVPAAGRGRLRNEDSGGTLKQDGGSAL